MAADTNEPTRIIVECEQMIGLNQNQFGPGAGWTSIVDVFYDRLVLGIRNDNQPVTGGF